MTRFEAWLTADLDALPQVIPLADEAFSRDAMANLLGVRVYKGGAPVTVPGTVKGYVILPDGSTITVDGGKRDNEAWVILPGSIYAIPGKISVYIKSVDGDSVITLGACQCVIRRALTEVTL